MIRKVDVEQDGVRDELRRQREPLARRESNEALEAVLMREIAQDSGKALVVFDDQKDSRAGAEPIAIVLYLSNGRRGHWRRARGRGPQGAARCSRGLCAAAGSSLRSPPGHRSDHVGWPVVISR